MCHKSLISCWRRRELGRELWASTCTFVGTDPAPAFVQFLLAWNTSLRTGWKSPFNVCNVKVCSHSPPLHSLKYTDTCPFLGTSGTCFWVMTSNFFQKLIGSKFLKMHVYPTRAGISIKNTHFICYQLSHSNIFNIQFFIMTRLILHKY